MPSNGLMQLFYDFKHHYNHKSLKGFNSAKQNKCMRKFLLFVFAFIYFQCWGQGNMITINSTVPSQMTVCGGVKTFTLAIYNPSPFLLTNDTLRITMPSGIAYQAGSITGAGVTEFNISTPNKPVFLLPAMPTLTYLNITFTAAASCDVMAFLAAGGIVENRVKINYLANGNNVYDEHLTSTYIVRQPNISISGFTNQSYSGAIGGSYSRCITVTNGGFGELSQFTLKDVHGSGLQIANVNNGVWVNSGNTETITLNGTHFSAIGDHDTLFENGEFIQICETVNILNCISVASAFEAYWGCGMQHCQSSTSNANVVFPNLIPNLVCIHEYLYGSRQCKCTAIENCKYRAWESCKYTTRYFSAGWGNNPQYRVKY